MQKIPANDKKNIEKYADMKVKSHVIKQWVGQQWDQGKNQKIPWKKWKWGCNIPKSVGHWERNPKREILNFTGPSQKIRQSSNKQSNFILKGTWNRTTNKAQSE